MKIDFSALLTQQLAKDGYFMCPDGEDLIGKDSLG